MKFNKESNILILVTLTACGRFTPLDSTVTPNSTVVQNSAPTILSSWTGGTTVVAALDFSHLTLNTQMSASTVLDCPANPPGGDASGNAAPGGTVLQVTKGNIEISGDATSGIVQFGPQPHDHTQTGICYVVGQEAYLYFVDGNSLTLCDYKYSICTTFSKEASL